MPHRHRALLTVPFVLLALLGAASEAGAATLAGSSAVQAGVDSNTAGRAEAFSAVAAASGQVTSLSVYVDASATATRAVVGLYANAGSHAGALLTQGTITAPTRGAWSTVTVPAASVTAGTTYWIAMLAPTGAGTLAFRDKGVGRQPVRDELAGLAGGAPGDLERRDDLSRRAGVRVRLVHVVDHAGALGGAVVADLRRDRGRRRAGRPVGRPSRRRAGAALPFTTASDAAWLSATPASGTAPATVRVAADAAGLGGRARTRAASP